MLFIPSLKNKGYHSSARNVHASIYFCRETQTRLFHCINTKKSNTGIPVALSTWDKNCNILFTFLVLTHKEQNHQLSVCYTSSFWSSKYYMYHRHKKPTAVELAKELSNFQGTFRFIVVHCCVCKGLHEKLYSLLFWFNSPFLCMTIFIHTLIKGRYKWRTALKCGSYIPW